MERIHKIIVTIGALACLLLFFADVYIGAIGAVLAGVLLMVFLISEDASNLPDLTAYLTENAKSIVIKNRGNAPAYNISVSLVPMNREFTIASLDADAGFEYAFDEMAGEVKSVVRYEDSRGNRIDKVSMLSSKNAGEEDLLKPLFPLFSWK